MNIYPAIDLRGGNCVRLVKGDFSRETVYSTDPGAMARKWADEGASCIHVVDLDGAVAGESRNLLSIDAILKQGNIPIEVGGGIRTMEHVARLLDRGVHQVILGSAAVKNSDLVKEACEKYPGRSWWASMPRTGTWQWKAGKPAATSRRKSWPGKWRKPGWNGSSSRTLPGTVCSAG